MYVVAVIETSIIPSATRPAAYGPYTDREYAEQHRRQILARNMDRYPERQRPEVFVIPLENPR